MIPHPNGYLVKLVRDRVSAWLGGTGTVTYRSMRHDEHVRRLRQKLIEEAVEYALEPSIEELAQVLEAVQALAIVDLRVEVADLERQRQREHAERGGFINGVGMYVLHPVDQRDLVRSGSPTDGAS